MAIITKLRGKFLISMIIRKIFTLWTSFFLVLINSLVFANTENQKLFLSEESINEQEVAQFLDKFFLEQMEKQHIPGVAIVIVKDGKTLFSRGYGYADIDKHIGVNPDKTLFRIASISKLFTATAIMQLVEKKKLNLQENVNYYLKDFQVKSYFKKPITVSDLLLHTAGFEDNSLALFSHKQSEVPPLKDYLQKYPAINVYPPGEIFSYSNYGYALAGYLVEVVSGMPFERYIEENIFNLLEMKNSSFNYKDSQKDLAIGYSYKNNQYQEEDVYFTNQSPSMGLITTATDLAPFMIAQLEKGIYQNKQLLSQQSIELMQTRQFAAHPKIAGNTMGFRDLIKNDKRAIRHDGRLKGFQSLMYLIPEKNLGFFLVYNCSENNFYLNFTQEFLNYFFPIKTSDPVPLINYQKRVEKFVGSYRNLRYSHTTIQKLDTLVSQYQISANEDGTITLYSPEEKPLGKWIEIEPFLFKKTDEDNYLAFRENKSGQITTLFYSYWFLEKLPFYETAKFQMSLIYFFISIFFISSIIFLVILIKYLRKTHIVKKLFFAQIIMFLISLLNFIFIITWLLIYQVYYEEALFSIPRIFTLILCIPLFSVGLTITLPIWSKIVWDYNSLCKRLYFCFFTLVALAFIPFLLYWNMLGFKFYQ